MKKTKTEIDLFYLYESSEEIRSFLEGISNSPKFLNERNIVSQLSSCSAEIDTTLRELIIRFQNEKSIRNKHLLAALGASAITLFMPLLAAGILTIGTLITILKYKKDTTHIRRLIKEYDVHREQIVEYTPAIASYDIDYIHNKNLLTNSYTEIIELISALDIKKQQEYLVKLQDIYTKNKHNTWELYIAIKDLKTEISELFCAQNIDSNFTVTNLLNYASSLEVLDKDLLNNILFHIYNLEYKEEQERFLLELASICLAHIESCFSTNEDISFDFLKGEVLKVPLELIKYLESYLDELLKDSQEYQKIKSKVISEDPNEQANINLHYICSILQLYNQNSLTSTRNS